MYDSAGPDGRVRGTPVQVIEKYQALAHDHSLAGDRVAMENFQQHAEHYIRLINEAQRQMAERREQIENQNRSQNSDHNQNRNAGGESGPSQNADSSRPDPSEAEQPDVKDKARNNDQAAKPETRKANPADAKKVAEASDGEQTGLVATPEDGAGKSKTSKPRRPRKPKEQSVEASSPIESGPAE